MKRSILLPKILGIVAAVTLIGVVGARANNTTHSLLGIDVSHYDGSVTWSSVYGDGVRYAFAKATEDTGFTDVDFSANMSHGKTAGVKMGAYHFAHTESTCPSSQVNHFWAVAGSQMTADGKSIMPMVDFETFSGVACGEGTYTTWFNDFRTDLDAKTALTIRPVIYVSACNACHLSSSITLGADIANYNGQNLYTGNPWNTCCTCNVWGGGCNANTWTYWQVSSTGAITGVPGNTDLDAYNGTLAELTSWQGI
jgi:lysozyme